MCAICFVDPTTSRRGTNATTRICDACRKETINGVRVNQDWVEDDARESIGREADVAVDAKMDSSISLQQLAERRIRTETEVQIAIIELFARGLVVKLPYVDRLGRRRGLRARLIELTEDDVAFLVGVEQPYVCKVLRAVLDISPVAVVE